MAELDVPQDLSDPRWKHFHPDVQGEFVGEEPDSTPVDETDLRLFYGSDVFEGDQSPLAEDLLELSSATLADDPELETNYLHASLIGKEELKRRLEEARRSGDEASRRAAHHDLYLVDPERFIRALEWAIGDDDSDSQRKSLAPPEAFGEDEGNPKSGA